MMETVREWLLSIVAVTMLLSVARTLIPEGGMRKAASLTGGLILLAALLQPVLKTDLDAIQWDISEYKEEITKRQTELEAAENEALALGIAERAEAYISDKAASLGLAVTVRVETAPGAEGIPLPAAAELWGPESQELAAWMEQELGIPAERQVWHEQEGKN